MEGAKYVPLPQNRRLRECGPARRRSGRPCKQGGVPDPSPLITARFRIRKKTQKKAAKASYRESRTSFSAGVPGMCIPGGRKRGCRSLVVVRKEFFGRENFAGTVCGSELTSTNQCKRYNDTVSTIFLTQPPEGVRFGRGFSTPIIHVCGCATRPRDDNEQGEPASWFRLHFRLGGALPR